jgi:hypothetical protein
MPTGIARQLANWRASMSSMDFWAEMAAPPLHFSLNDPNATHERRTRRAGGMTYCLYLEF